MVYSGTFVLIVNSFRNSWQELKVTSTGLWSIFSCRVASWLIQVLTSVTSGKQVPSAETFFLNQMWRIPGLTSSEASECWGTTIFPLCYCLLHFSSWNYLGIYNKIYMYDCLSCTPYWGLGPQPRHVPWLGIGLATLWLTGQHSIHWATPAKANFSSILWLSSISLCKCPIVVLSTHLLMDTWAASIYLGDCK